MMSHRAVMEDYYRAMGEGDFDHVVSLHSPDIICWMSGRSLVSGRFQGRDDLYAHMGQHVLGPLVVGSEPYVKGSRLVIVDGDLTVGLLHGGLPAQDGGRYNQFYLQIFRYEKGLITEIVELFDTVMVETQLFKHRLTTPRLPPAAPFHLDAPAITSALTRDGMVSLAQAFVDALAVQHFPRAVSCCGQNAEIRVIGSTPYSGCTTDLKVLAHIFADGLSYARVAVADAGAAVVLAQADSGDHVQQFGLLIEADGEKIGCISVFLDTAAAEAQVFDNPLCPAPSTSIMPPFDVTKVL